MSSRPGTTHTLAGAQSRRACRASITKINRRVAPPAPAARAAAADNAPADNNAAPAARLGAAAPALLSLALLHGPSTLFPLAAHADSLPPQPKAARSAPSGAYVADGARMLSDEDELKLTRRLAALEAESGWRLRVVTVDGLSTRGGREAARAALSLPAYASSLPSFDRRTVVLQADPSAPALLSVPYAGDDALKALGRPFFSELESRYGNQFYARDNGSPKALRDAVAALELCLARDPPCRVVPGLPDEQLGACVTFAIAGGIIAGSASKIKGGNGPLQWVALFGPLWFSLVASFGVGPVVSRLGEGERGGPVAMVLAAFAVAALLPWAPEALGTRKPPANTGGGV